MNKHTVKKYHPSKRDSTALSRKEINRTMKNILLLVALAACSHSFGQKCEFFAGIQLDSSFTILGIGQGKSEARDSLERFWFVLDNLQDMQQIQRDWVFKRPVSSIHLDDHPFDVFVIKDKQLVASGLIYPYQGNVTVGKGWYRFDTTILKRLHATHPIHYHSQKRTFDTYPQYGSYGNTLLQDSTVLFFFQPYIRFEGSFALVSDQTTDPSSLFSEINKELLALSPGGHFETGLPKLDTTTSPQHKKLRIEVSSSKSLYDQYNNKKREKGPWQPTAISTTVFWRDQ
jgi:hypothetical protein